MKRFTQFVLILLIVIYAPGQLKNVFARNTSNLPTEVTTPHQVGNVSNHNQKQISLKEPETRDTVPVKSNGKSNDENIVLVIKVGSYTNLEYAESESKRLKEMGFNSYVDTVLRKGKTLYVLKIGDFTDRKEAKKIQNDLRKKAPKLKAYILREKGGPGGKSVNNHTVSGNGKKAVASEKKNGTGETTHSVKSTKPVPQKKNVASPKEKGGGKSIPLKSNITKDNPVYTIKAGSYKNREYADRESIQLKKMGFTNYIQRAVYEGEVWYRVKVGDFTKREEAETQQEQLAQKFPELKSYIVEEQRKAIKDKAKAEHAFAIQVGSHKNREYADSDLKRLKQSGFAGYVQPAVYKGETWYRLKVGDFNSRGEASKTERQLAQKFPELKSYIVEVQGKAQVEKGSQNNAYSVQVSSHINLEYAGDELKRLKQLGFGGYVQPAVHEGETWYRVKMGDFSSREEAAKAEKQLVQKLPEVNSYIVEEDENPQDRIIISPSVVKEEEGTSPLESVEEERIDHATPKAEEPVSPKEENPATPEVKKPSAQEVEKTEKGMQKVTLDFENADIKEVITALAEIVGINYIIDPKVRGIVNIHTSGEIPVEGVFPILETIFDINNVAAVKVGDIYKIIPIKDAQKQPLIPQVENTPEDPTSPDRTILQIVPLRFVASQEMEKILKRFLGKGGDIVNFADRNILIIVDTAANMQKLLTLIDTIDLSIFDTMHVRFYELEDSEAKDLAKELEDLFAALGLDTKKKKGGGGEVVRFIPIERLNIILAVSSMPDIFEKVTEWIEKLDGVREELEEQIFIYFVENAKAIDIGDIIKELYGDKKKERDKKQPTRTTRAQNKRAKLPIKRAISKTGTSVTTGEIKVVVDEVNNAVIVRATPQDYAQVLKTIKLLDIIPKQVLIEVLIAEVTLDKNSEFGVEWTFASDYASLGGYKGIDRVGQNFNLGGLGLDLTQPVGASGFTYAFASEALEAFLRAYSRENEVKILSTPHILVQDNTEAKIDVGEEVPIVTSEYTPTSVQVDTSLSRSIEYRDTGILLTVTPRINDKGLVTMEVNQEVSNVSEQRLEGIDSPIILKRQAQTSLVVQDGRTIIIGGLIRDQKEITKEGIPYLYKIPYLGMMFGYTKEILKKTELIFLITPHVIQNLEEAELVTQEFKEKVKSLIKLIGD